MPFKHYLHPSIHDWKPDHDSFNHEEDRILVHTNLGERIVLAWSSDERSTGSFVIAPEAIPNNIRPYFGSFLDRYEYKPGEFVQPMLLVYQQDDNSLRAKLAHPAFVGSFHITGQVRYIRSVRRGEQRHSPEVNGRGSWLNYREPVL